MAPKRVGVLVRWCNLVYEKWCIQCWFEKSDSYSVQNPPFSHRSYLFQPYLPHTQTHTHHLLPHSLFITHTLTHFSAYFLSHIHPHQPYVSFKYSSLSAPVTYHTLTTYHSNTHPCQSHLPLTHSPFTTYTLTHVSPTYLSHIHVSPTNFSHTHHLPLTHSLPLIHSPMSVPVTTHTITHIRAIYLSHTDHLPLTHTHTHISMSALLTSHILTTYHSHTHLC